MKDLVWHIDIEEERSKWEAYYIDMLIRGVNKNYKRILDLACGQGRLHPYLKQLGYEIVGVELNKEFVEKAKQRNPDITYYQMDMRKIDFKEEFDMVLSWFTSLFYFSDEEHIELIKKINRALKKGGLFILDTVMRKEITIPFNIIETEDYIIIEKHSFENNRWILNQRVYKKENKNLIFIDENEVRVRIYDFEELVKLIENNGFKVLKAFKRRSVSEYKKGDSGITLLALKEK